MELKGISASRGITIGRALKLEKPNFNIELKTVDDVDNALKKLEVAFSMAKEEINLIKEISLNKFGSETALVFDAHLLVLEDPEMKRMINAKISDNLYSASYSVYLVREEFITMFKNIDNEYMRERAADIKDVTDRVLAHLTGKNIPDLTLIDSEVILVAEDLAPSDTAQLDKNFVLGFVTEMGGKTSHTAIMARSLQIPSVVGLASALNNINNDDYLIVDGNKGKVIVNPSVEELKFYRNKREQYLEEQFKLEKFKNRKTLTKDNHQIELACNIGGVDEVDGLLINGAEGVGLFRTEFLFMGRKQLPTEEEQFLAYKEVLTQMKGNPVVIRTLDIGGDKELTYFKMEKELNPFLGVRAIRLCLENEDMFMTQLKALARVSKFGNLHIMFPMIATIDELREAKRLLKKACDLVIEEGYEIGDHKVGMMMEIPSAAIIADVFAKEVDFFSIGTNDLIQYTMAADRMNQGVSYLYQPYNPAILKLISNIIDASHKEGIWTGMCGEMASDLKAIPILLGLGLDEFSVSSSLVLEVRKYISTLNMSELREKARKALQMSTSTEVRDLYK